MSPEPSFNDQVKQGPTGFSAYQHARWSPVRFTDPDGKRVAYTEDARLRAKIQELRASSETFRRSYRELDRDETIYIFRNRSIGPDAAGNEQYGVTGPRTAPGPKGEEVVYVDVVLTDDAKIERGVASFKRQFGVAINPADWVSFLLGHETVGHAGDENTRSRARTNEAKCVSGLARSVWRDAFEKWQKRLRTKEPDPDVTAKMEERADQAGLDVLNEEMESRTLLKGERKEGE